MLSENEIIVNKLEVALNKIETVSHFLAGMLSACHSKQDIYALTGYLQSFDSAKALIRDVKDMVRS